MNRFLIILLVTAGIASAQNEAVTINTKTKKVVNPLVNFGTGNTVDFTGATVEGLTPDLTFADSLLNTASTVTLVNDSATPGNSKYYGTDSGGVLGYHTLSAGGVTSFNTRSGAVTSQTGDYTASQVTGAVPDTRTVNGHALSGNVSVTASDVGAPSGSGTSSGTNTGDQTSIVGISGTLSEFNIALTGADFATGGGVITGTSSGTNTGDQDLSSLALKATTISTNSPLTGGGDLSTNRTFAINDAAADGTTKGASTFAASDFNATSGVVSIDYTNGQAASGSTKGFLTAADWTTFNGKLSGNQTITLSGDVTGSGATAITTTLASIPAIAGTNLTGTGANFTAGNATKLTTGRTIALTGGVTYTSGSFDGSGNVTGTATVATNANLTGPITSSGNATAIASQTGTGTKFVVDTSPTLVTPVLGVATATSINGNTFTTGTYTLTGVAGKTLTFNKSLTLDGTDSTTMTFPSTSATIARTDAANTFTGASTATSWTFTTPVLGTPTSGTLTNCTGTADGLTAGDVTRNHATYAAASPPTVDVGTFTVVKTGVDLKTNATTDIFTVPTGRIFQCDEIYLIVTAVTSGVSVGIVFKAIESGGSNGMTIATAQNALAPVTGRIWREVPSIAGGPYFTCAAGNKVQLSGTTMWTSSTTVTGSVFVRGSYVQ